MNANSRLMSFVVAGAWLAAACPAPAADRQAVPIAQGRELFERQWVAGETVQPGGDGLGPVFNHVSCAACHRQGGLGGSGPVDVNAAMLSVDVPKLPEAPQRKAFLAALKAVHPGFLTPGGDIRPNLILHRFGTDPRYSALRQNLLGAEVPFQPTDDQRDQLQQQLAREPVRPVSAAAPLSLVVTQRNTSALFGARLIDAIPDATLHSLAAAQNSHPEISGRVAPIDMTKAGRFGWRGQIEHLHDFVLGACANEMGLEVPGNPQPVDPLLPEYRPSGQDLSAAQCLTLTAFVASLPPPKLVPPADADKQKLAAGGRKLFHAVGCAACHLESIGQVPEIYSDLLLHDLGPALADPVGAQPTMVAVSRQLTSREAMESQTEKPVAQFSAPQYYGGSVVTAAMFASGSSSASLFERLDLKTAIKTEFRPAPTNLAQEWRTPPLWGLADSAPYLHDGRAATPLEAIALHGGEAEKCTTRFWALSTADRLAVLEFLNCLQAP